MAEFSGTTRRKSRKHLWFAVHGWMALPIWGLLSLICITGTLSVFNEEVTWLLSPEVRAENPHDTQPLGFDALLGAVKAQYPGAVIRSVQVSEPYTAYLVRTSLSDGAQKVLHLNQYTGEIQGEMESTGYRGFMLALHGWLLFPWQDDHNLGWYIVTATAIPLLGSLITGLLIMKRFWRVLYRPRLRLDKGSRVFWGDLHRLVGAWSVWFVLLIAVSGLWFLVTGILDHNHVPTYREPPMLARDSVPTTELNQVPPTVTLHQAIATAKNVYPDLHVEYIEFPKNAYASLTVRGTRDFSVFRDTANAVHLNPFTGEIVGSSKGNLSLVQGVSALLVPLHFGDFAGLASKFIWFLFGSLLSFMVCSGFVIWSRRTVSSTKQLSTGGASSRSGYTGARGPSHPSYIPARESGWTR